MYRCAIFSDFGLSGSSHLCLCKAFYCKVPRGVIKYRHHKAKEGETWQSFPEKVIAGV